MSTARAILATTALTAGLLLPCLASAESLHWSALEVEARLDPDGRLHMVERHSMVFDGSQNGGERIFDFLPEAVLELRAVRRRDPEAGRFRPLRAGDLTAVDHYRLDGTHLRWRSRLPSDPAFDNTTLVYEIEYSITGVVVALDNGGYRLEHDFLFADRPGPIESFELEIRIDRPWRLEQNENFELGGKGPGKHWRVTGGPLPPGRSHALSLLLTHHGKSLPKEVAQAGP